MKRDDEKIQGWLIEDLNKQRIQKVKEAYAQGQNYIVETWETDLKAGKMVQIKISTIGARTREKAEELKASVWKKEGKCAYIYPLHTIMEKIMPNDGQIRKALDEI